MYSASGRLDDEIVESYDFKQSLNFLKGFGPMSGEQEFEGGAVTKAVMLDGRTIAFRVSEKGEGAGAGGEGKLRYELFSGEPLTKSVEDSVAERVASFFSLGDDIKPFYSMAKSKDARFYPLVERLWGLHQVKFPTLLEASCWAILSQRVQRPIALRMKRALIERFGGSIELEGKTYCAFPDHTKLKDATVKELLAATRNQRTVQRLTSLLASFDELGEDFLRTAPYDKASARLQTIKGIGDLVVAIHPLPRAREDRGASARQYPVAVEEDRASLRAGREDGGGD